MWSSLEYDHVVGVGPIGEVHRVTIDVEVIEGVPDPVGISVRVDVDDGVADDWGGPWVSGAGCVVPCYKRSA